MNAHAAAGLALAVLGLLFRPASAQWHCRQGRVELIVGGAHGCVQAAPSGSPAPTPGPLVMPAPQRQRDLARRTILETELRQEQAVLAALHSDGRDPARLRRTQDNIDALQRELAR